MVRLRKTWRLPSKRSSEWSGDLAGSLQYPGEDPRWSPIPQENREPNDKRAREKNNFLPWWGPRASQRRRHWMWPWCMRKGPGITAFNRAFAVCPATCTAEVDIWRGRRTGSLHPRWGGFKEEEMMDGYSWCLFSGQITACCDPDTLWRTWPLPLRGGQLLA